MSDQIFLMPEFSSRGIHPKGWESVKPHIRPYDHAKELSELACKFQIAVVNQFEDAYRDRAYGDDLHLHLVEQMNNAGLVAEYVQHGHIDLASSRLAMMASEYMSFGEGRSKYADKVWALCEKFAEDAGMKEQEDQNGQVDVDRPGLF